MPMFWKRKKKEFENETMVIIEKEIIVGTCPVKNELMKHFKTNKLLIPKTNSLYDLLRK